MEGSLRPISRGEGVPKPRLKLAPGVSIPIEANYSIPADRSNAITTRPVYSKQTLLHVASLMGHCPGQCSVYDPALVSGRLTRAGPIISSRRMSRR